MYRWNPTFFGVFRCFQRFNDRVFAFDDSTKAYSNIHWITLYSLRNMSTKHNTTLIVIYNLNTRQLRQCKTRIFLFFNQTQPRQSRIDIWDSFQKSITFHITKMLYWLIPFVNPIITYNRPFNQHYFDL